MAIANMERKDDRKHSERASGMRRKKETEITRKEKEPVRLNKECAKREEKKNEQSH